MNATSQQRSAIRLLDKYRCDHCQKWKPNALFSKKQHDSYRNKIASVQMVNGITAKLRCLACVGQPNELKCLRCGITYALDMFSKQARKNGGSQWCKSCVSWKEAQEPGVTTAPAVSTEISPDEQDLYDTTSGSYGGYDNGAMSDPEGGYESDGYTDSYAGYGYQSTLGSQLENASSAIGALSLVGASENETMNAPFGLPLRAAAGGAENVSTDAPFGLPLRTPAGGAENASTYIPSGLPLRTPAPGAVSTYTAYDAQGNAHVRQYAPSEMTSEASNATVAPTRASAWAKPAGRRTEAAMTRPVVANPGRQYDSEDEDEM